MSRGRFDRDANLCFDYGTHDRASRRNRQGRFRLPERLCQQNRMRYLQRWCRVSRVADRRHASGSSCRGISLTEDLQGWPRFSSAPVSLRTLRLDHLRWRAWELPLRPALPLPQSCSRASGEQDRGRQHLRRCSRSQQGCSWAAADPRGLRGTWCRIRRRSQLRGCPSRAHVQRLERSQLPPERRQSACLRSLNHRPQRSIFCQSVNARACCIDHDT